jgi:hypothetical protein
MMGMLVDMVRLRLRQLSAVVSGFAKPAGRIKQCLTRQACCAMQPDFNGLACAGGRSKQSTVQPAADGKVWRRWRRSPPCSQAGHLQACASSYCQQCKISCEDERAATLPIKQQTAPDYKDTIVDGRGEHHLGSCVAVLPHTFLLHCKTTTSTSHTYHIRV